MLRRTFLTRLAHLTIAAVASTTIVACGSSGSSGSGTTGETRVVKDADGKDITVPTKPQRVVTLSEPTMDAAIALGITPIGTVTGRGQSTVPSYLMEQAKDVEILGAVAQPNFEAIGAAKPDLILTDGTSINNNQVVIDALARIAPVVVTGFAGGSWRDNLRFTADALNVADKAKKLESDYDAKAQKLAKDLAKDYSENTFSIVRWQGSSAALILKDLLPGQALEDLGLKRPPFQDRKGKGHSEPVSIENLAEIDADFMFFGTLGGSSQSNPNAGGTADVADAMKALEAAKDTPGFTDLNAFQNNQIIPVEGSAWTSSGGPILMNRILDDVSRALL